MANRDGATKYRFTGRLDQLMQGCRGFEALRLEGRSAEAGIRKLSRNIEKLGANDKVAQSVSARKKICLLGTHFMAPEGFNFF